MNVDQPAKFCPACGADLSARTAAMPGVCPACGRDLKLEAIVAELSKQPDEKTSKKPPLSLVACWWISVSLAFFLGIAVSGNDNAAFIPVMIVVAPNLFFGFFVAGHWNRTKLAHLSFGFLLGVGFIVASWGLIRIDARTIFGP